MEVHRGVVGRVVEATAGVVLIIAGCIAQGVGSGLEESPGKTTLIVLGNIMVIVGGVAITWIASLVFAERQAVRDEDSAAKAMEEAVAATREQLDDKLDNLSRAIGQSASQLSLTVARVREGDLPAASGLELINQTTLTLFGQANEIAVIRGAAFDADELLSTARRLTSLARELSDDSLNDSRDDAQAELRTIQESLERATRERASVAVTCPYCGTPDQVSLGVSKGDTASPTCSVCGRQFYVHRGESGTWRVNIQGGRLQPQPALVGLPAVQVLSCPKCERAIRVKSEGSAQRTVLCPGCLSPLDVDLAEQTIDVVDGYTTEASGDFARSGVRPKIYCPTCSRTIKTVVITKEGFAAICRTDRLVLTVTNAAFDDFLRSQQPSAELA